MAAECAFPNCEETAGIFVRCKPGQTELVKEKGWWVCYDHGEELVEKGYEPDGRLFELPQTPLYAGNDDFE